MDKTIDGITFRNYRIKEHNRDMVIIISDSTCVESKDGSVEEYGFKSMAIHRLQLEQRESTLKVYSYIN